MCYNGKIIGKRPYRKLIKYKGSSHVMCVSCHQGKARPQVVDVTWVPPGMEGSYESIE
jgi:hypothetical protein